jgi:heme/copper-type cytochrome/quinol oxidase subunit 3
MRACSVPWLGGQGVKVFTNIILWPHFEGVWPTNGPAHVGGFADGTFETVPAFGLPAINTADSVDQRLHRHHRAPRAARRQARDAAVFLALTFLLGFTFVGTAGARVRRGLSRAGPAQSTGIYGSTFFMLTGFHGLHVTIGAIMLTVIWLRVLRGHFTPHNHFAFEAVAWYWHFVDVVWLGLFVFVYWLASAVSGRLLVRRGDQQRVGRDEPEIPGEHQQRKQRDRQRDAHGERAHEPAGVLLAVARQMVERRAEAPHDRQQTQQRQEPHQLSRIGCQSSALPARGAIAYVPSACEPVAAASLRTQAQASRCWRCSLAALFVRLGFWQWQRGVEPRGSSGRASARAPIAA